MEIKSVPGLRVEEVLNSSRFRKLVKNRWKVSLIMTVIILSAYFGFILTIAFNKEFLAQKIASHLTLGLPVGIGIILFAWILTGAYVWWANNHYDQQVEELKNELKIDE